MNYKQEKDKFLNLLKEQNKQYDLSSIKTDLDGKITHIVDNIKKEEKRIITDEER